MKMSVFSPASFMIQGARKPAVSSRPQNISTSTTSPTSNLGGDKASIGGGGGGQSLADQMRSLKAKVGKASSSWLEQSKQDLGLTSKESKAFKAKHEERGWDVKGPDNRDDFKPKDMNGKPVAFRVKDEKTGEMVEKKGVLKPSGEEGGSKFSLDGQKGEFDSKHIHDMAVNNQAKLPPERQQFRDKFQGKDWKTKHERNSNDFSPAELSGREVAFQTKDPKTGKMVEHRGVMEADPDPNKSAIFKLKGKEGEFNNNQIKEMAVNDKFGKKFEEKGWTVKNKDNADQFHPEKMDGREVAFRHPDEDGQMMTKMGQVQLVTEFASMALFTMVGMGGMTFNPFIMPEMAMAPMVGMGEF